MKQYKIINAFKALETLSDNENLTDFDQWHIYKLRKLLRPHIEFQQEREAAIQEKYQQYADDKGMLKDEKAQEFMKELQTLTQLDVEMEEFKKPQIKIVKGITCKIIEPLEDFIEFTEPTE